MSTPINFKGGDIQLGVWKYLTDVSLPAVFGCVSNQGGSVTLNGGFVDQSGAIVACTISPSLFFTPNDPTSLVTSTTLGSTNNIQTVTIDGFTPLSVTPDATSSFVSNALKVSNVGSAPVLAPDAGDVYAAWINNATVATAFANLPDDWVGTVTLNPSNTNPAQCLFGLVFSHSGDDVATDYNASFPAQSANCVVAAIDHNGSGALGSHGTGSTPAMPLVFQLDVPNKKITWVGSLNDQALDFSTFPQIGFYMQTVNPTVDTLSVAFTPQQYESNVGAPFISFTPGALTGKPFAMATGKVSSGSSTFQIPPDNSYFAAFFHDGTLTEAEAASMLASGALLDSVGALFMAYAGIERGSATLISSAGTFTHSLPNPAETTLAIASGTLTTDIDECPLNTTLFPYCSIAITAPLTGGTLVVDTLTFANSFVH